MVIDCHVHVSAFSGGRGMMSRSLQRTIPFRFMRWRLGMEGEDERTDDALANLLAKTIGECEALDAAAVLAFDAVYDADGSRDDARTHLYVSNDYVMQLAAKHPKMLFGASIHPYRRDAVEELERCVEAGAVLLKWLPLTQGIDPADDRCTPLYEALAHFGLPLLSHTGGETAMPCLDSRLADPRLLEPALRRGVTVIAAHCATRSAPWERCYLHEFVRMAKEHEHLYGDTAALNLPSRCHAWPTLLNDDAIRRKLIHGSDWPILSLPPLRAGVAGMREAFAERNWMRRDILIKKRLGLDEAYWQRAGAVLRLRR
jgi:predicted TIM-barrel fold metal-dependent hydrolase